MPCAASPSLPKSALLCPRRRHCCVHSMNAGPAADAPHVELAAGFLFVVQISDALLDRQRHHGEQHEHGSELCGLGLWWGKGEMGRENGGKGFVLPGYCTRHARCATHHEDMHHVALLKEIHVPTRGPSIGLR